MKVIYHWVSLFINVRSIIALKNLPRYLLNFIKYRQTKTNSEKLLFRDSYPCLSDMTQTTPFDAHYFFQAAWLARHLNKSQIKKHVDIGSDVKMIGVLSAFVDTEFFDYRPLDVELDGLVCKAGNITALPIESSSIQSLSCQHVIEHIGLGRYGDPLNPDGSIAAAKELERILKSSGKLYLSLPVGRERVCFNAHRVYAPSTVVTFFSDLKMLSFSFVDDNGDFFENKTLDEAEGCDYACGMYVFEKH
jgi:hypothetical protein